jgi:PleD family two-component response regulator
VVNTFSILGVREDEDMLDMLDMLDMQDKPKILVVDDDATNVMVLVSMLKNEGYLTVAGNNGLEAFDRAKETLPDLVLLDIMMPEVDGFEVCRRLKQDSTTTDIPVIFLSALDDIDSKVLAFDVGGVDYIGKPFQKPEVLARVRLHLKLSVSLKEAVTTRTEKFRQLQEAQQAILVSPETGDETFETKWMCNDCTRSVQLCGVYHSWAYESRGSYWQENNS